jgi:endonuclease/exonuclease/phosphatase family metal-dependent hydrolase
VAQAGIQAVKLLQLNVWMGRLTRQIVPLIEREQPDIITAQEVFSAGSEIVFPDRTFNIAEEIRQYGGYDYVYFSPTWDMHVAGQTVQLGNATFSKYPIASSETIFTCGEAMHNMTADNYRVNTRNAQFVTLRVGGADILIVNHHAYWEADPAGSEASVTAMQHVTDKLRTFSDIPTVVAGDMNLNPNTPGMRLFDGIARDLTATHNISSTLSVLGKAENVACDHILVNDLIVVGGFHVLDDLVSDHKALMLEFDIC